MKTPGYSIFEMAPLERRPNNARSAARGFRRGSIKPKRINILSRALLNLSAIAFITCSVNAQIQRAWVARYDNGLTNAYGSGNKIALDSVGNILVGGWTRNINGGFGYVMLKYGPSGTPMWVARYDSGNYPSAIPFSMAIDVSNNIILTGSGATVKFDSNGNQRWTAPYTGTALAVDSQGNAYVTGFSKDFGTVKISPQGSNVWLETYVESYGPTVSQSVMVDGGGNVYVSGLDSFQIIHQGSITYGPYVQLTTIKYGPNGNQLWKASQQPGNDSGNLQVAGTALDAFGNLYLVSNWPLTGYYTIKYASNGTNAWSAFNPEPNCGSVVAYALALDTLGNVLVTGWNCYGYGTYKANTNGSWIWTNSSPAGMAFSIAVDSANNCYVTGSSPNTNSTNDIVTIKYDLNGNQVWLQRYNAYNAGNDEGNAIVVDKNGNVYVTGDETLPGGGIGIVTIKYSPVVVQRRSDGSIILDAQGSPGESFAIEASEDLQSWLGIGNATADTNGLAQFTDTNAPAYLARFYLANPQ